MKLVLIVTALSISFYCNCQQLEIYAAPGFFFEQLNKDSLVPPERRNASRLGDVTTYALQVALPLKNKHWEIKAGAGISTRHYSLNKYSIGDLIGNLFLFDAQLPSDTFAVSYIRLTDHYFQVPVSAAYVLNPSNSHIHVELGLNIRSDFLTNSKADVRFDSRVKTPTQPQASTIQNLYTQNASKFVLTVEPYLETNFTIYKSFGFYTQLRPFSFYSYKLNKQYTSSTIELFSFTFGFSFRLNNMKHSE